MMRRKIRVCFTAAGALVFAMVLAPMGEAVYHPELGRFINRDPSEYTDGLNLYNYSGNRPVILTDATGGCASRPCKCFCVDSITLVESTTWPNFTVKNPAQSAGTLFVGTQFTLKFKGRWLDHDTFAPFGFEWWEWFTEKPSDPLYKDLPPRQWHNIYAIAPDHGAFEEVNPANWSGDLKEEYTVSDRPGVTSGALNYRVDQTAYFAVRVTSGCPKETCPTREKAYLAKQRYVVQGGAPLDVPSFHTLRRLPSGAPGDPPWKPNP
jgi:hypothetical protein